MPCVVHVLRDMLRQSSPGKCLFVAPNEPTVIPDVLAALHTAGFATAAQVAAGRGEGGDILVRDLQSGIGEIFDFTLGNEGSMQARGVPPNQTADALEAAKSGLYARRYQAISYRFRGLAMERGCRLGSNIIQLLKECRDRLGDSWVLSDAGRACSASNDCFVRYWKQQIICMVQVDTCSKLVEARARVLGASPLRTLAY